jgi:hypothetical protein
MLRTQIDIPNEVLLPGPRGHRVQVVDFDSTANILYEPAQVNDGLNATTEAPRDPFESVSDDEMLGSPAFHAFMTYGVIMKTLARFEFALGRRVSWSFTGPQIQVAPHAFADANAFYSPRSQGLFFGYFPKGDGRGNVFSCLSHEVVAHETTHALLDGLRQRYTDPSSPQQAGFHEGFADVVALLSILSSEEVSAKVIDLGLRDNSSPMIERRLLSVQRLRDSALFGLAQEMGSEVSGIHGQALRRSVVLRPDPQYLHTGACDEPHRCGEVLVAAVINAYLAVWVERLKDIGDQRLNRSRVVEEGAEIADRLLTMCIRALDYCPPTDLQFCDFASAALTADWELNPIDRKYGLRKTLLETFRAYGIEPSSGRKDGQEGAWDPPRQGADSISYDRTHNEQLKTDVDEVFRFIWENQAALEINREAFSQVLSVRPCMRIGRDGFVLRETVVEFHQQLKLKALELGRLGLAIPAGMPDNLEVTLYGGNALIFDEYGQLKYNVGNAIMDQRDKTRERQSKRLQYLWDHGFYSKGASKLRAFAGMHRRRSTDWYYDAPTPE